MSKPNKNKIYRLSFLLIFCMLLFTSLYGCGTGPDVAAGSTPTPTPTPASINLSATPTTVKSDGSTTATITVNALNASNAALSGVTVTMSTDTGVLSAASVVTNITTPATVTLSSGRNKNNRTATITATAGSVTAQIPIQIVGSTITLTATGTSLPADGSSPVTLTATAKDAGGNAVSGTAVTLPQTGSGSVAITSATGTTNASGIFTATVAGTGAGAVTITATTLGATATTGLTVATAANVFAIESLSLNGGASYNTDPTAMKINGDTLNVTVNAPGVTTVTFATTIGLWNATNKVLDVTVVGGKATAQLTTSLVGIANVQVYNKANPNTSDTLTVAMSSGAAANKIVLQAAPTILPVSVGTTTGSSTLTATVYDASNNPLGGQSVAFSIVDGTSTSGDETISPVVVMTATTSSGGLSVGQARATFTSGSMPSSATGVKVRAYIVGTTATAPEVRTGLSPSGNDVAIVIGGVAGSIAFGQDSKAAEDSTGANYEYKMSVLVADSNGNPVAGAVVNLGIWPVAWCTGSGCACDADTATTGTFWNEDRNENLILDSTPTPQEDGARCYYADSTKCSGGSWLAGGKVDNLITPTNSVGGTVPASVTTDANGVAGFIVTYPKSSGIWIYDRIRATTIVQGSETRAEIILYLKIVVGEETICSESPFKF
jgi:hypothetical protein